MHVDECDVTFNIGLSDMDAFEGSDLVFCGMLASPEHRHYLASYKHVKGRCVAHCGKRRHGALNITAGERASLIVWTKSGHFRKSSAYAAKVRVPAHVKEVANPDTMCLSYTHDLDYSTWVSTSRMQIVVRGKLPDADIEISVEPQFRVSDVAEILCYGVSRRGGVWQGWRVQSENDRTPPLASLMRFSFRSQPQLPFDKTLEACGVGPGDVLVYTARAVRTCAVFCKAWDRLNGECVYLSTRCGLSPGGASETGFDMRQVAYRLVAAEVGAKLTQDDLKLSCVRTGAPIRDTTPVKSLLHNGDCLVCLRIELKDWVRRRRAFLIVEKGEPLLMTRGSFDLAPELKLLLFLRLHREDEIFRRIVSYL
eukprot:TRINITY_DN50902_c0_g1_i1.p1 TRINITY_DN50902_c0_g1~~TRINITY_DN50902_c0_g1_i1.p1  ORF type:complete len:416 (-),score=25.04 TRINITY_DN50902_c0_g1_i1:7-1107(-)